jgi:cytochrome c-type biogenesis protein CcmH/NrfF
MRKKLECPICNFSRLVDSDIRIKSELKAESKTNWVADYYVKCPKCKNEIGIRKII